MMELAHGKRKYLFCADLTGGESFTGLVQQALEKRIPFDLKMIGQEPDSYIDKWFSQQKMGTYLYLSGETEFVNRIKKLAFEAGFSEEEMQLHVCGPIKKRLVCCRCYGINGVAECTHITCAHCGHELDVSDHYSRRLDAYLGYVTIK